MHRGFARAEISGTLSSTLERRSPAGADTKKFGPATTRRAAHMFEAPTTSARFDPPLALPSDCSLSLVYCVGRGERMLPGVLEEAVQQYNQDGGAPAQSLSAALEELKTEVSTAASNLGTNASAA